MVKIEFDNQLPLELIKQRSINQPALNLSLYSLQQTHINSRECPYCGSHKINSNGNYRGRKRYRCMNCRKSYNDLTKTPFSGVHDLEKILSYLNCLIYGLSIRKAAEIVHISINTSFHWRHRLLNGFKKLPSPKMKNVREIMELKLPYSHKGQRTKLTKELKNSIISAIFICDRTGKLDSDAIQHSQRQNNPVLNRLREISNTHTEIICPTIFFNNFKLSNTTITTSSSNYSNMDLITKIISQWKKWMTRFHGVASKYIANYLHWFDYLDNSLLKENKTSKLIQLLLNHY